MISDMCTKHLLYGHLTVWRNTCFLCRLSSLFDQFSNGLKMDLVILMAYVGP